MWEGVLLLARLPALNPAVGFLFQPLAWPVDFRSSAPHHNPPFLELATTSSPCQAMKLRDRALNLELPGTGGPRPEPPGVVRDAAAVLRWCAVVCVWCVFPYWDRAPSGKPRNENDVK